MPDLTQTILSIFPKKTVVVVGDLVADQFLSGTISRVSREAPVFIMRHEETVTLPGAAANAAANVASLGGSASLIGVAGDDDNGCNLLDALSASGVDTDGIAVVETRSTTTKVRVLAGQQFAARNQVIRIDYEDGGELAAELKEQLRTQLRDRSEQADAIIVSDYDYGAVFPELFEDAVTIAKDRDIPLVVDSRFRLTEFKAATSATPNREEVENILGPGFSDADCEALRARLGLAALVVTNGSEGMTLYEGDRQPHKINAAGPLSPVDVTGAGDTVIAAYTLALASGMSFADAAKLANHAGGVAVMKKRTATVSADDVLTSIRSYPDSALSNQA